MPKIDGCPSSSFEDIARSVRLGVYDPVGFGATASAILKICQKRTDEQAIPTREKDEGVGENHRDNAGTWDGFAFDPAKRYYILDEGGPPYCWD